MEKTLKKIIGNNSHWTINKTLARTIGLNTTLVLQHLIDLSSVFKRKEIFQPIPEMAEELALSQHAIKTSIAELKKKKLISVERKKVGFKNFYVVHEENVLELMEGGHLASELNTADLSSEYENSHESAENLLTSELDTAVSELNTIPQRVENLPAITNNTTNNTLEKNINKNTITKSGSGSDKNIIQKKILDILVDGNSDIKQYNIAVEEYNEIGGIDTISEIMGWDDSVKNNWFREIQNVYAIK